MTGYWKACLGVLLVFATGCLCGGLGTSVYDHHNTTVLFQRGSAAYLDALQTRLTSNLNLDAGQKQQIYRFMLDSLSHRKRIQARIQPALQMVNYQLIMQIQSILRPDQARQFRDNLNRSRKYAVLAGIGERAPQPATPGDATENANAPGTAPAPIQ